MSWGDHHRQSEQLASLAETAARAGQLARAENLYRQAAEAETRALGALYAGKERTRAITAVSAAALSFKGRDFEATERIAHQFLASDDLPKFAVVQLRGLLQSVWSEQARTSAGVRFARGDVLVAVKGGEVVYGGAPLDLIVRKVEEVRALFYRTIEMLLHLPLRVRGGPTDEVQQFFRPWLFQAPAGSYQFAIRIQEPEQMALFPASVPQVDEVASTFISIVKASIEDPEGELVQLVPDDRYRETFLKLTRNLAPTGKGFGELNLLDASSPASKPIAIVPAAREALNATLRKSKPPSVVASDEVIQLRGTLRAVHLDKDWLELTLVGSKEHVTVHEVGEVLDDVIGPMVNRKVLVDCVRGPRGRLAFRDIQPEE